MKRPSALLLALAAASTAMAAPSAPPPSAQAAHAAHPAASGAGASAASTPEKGGSSGASKAGAKVDSPGASKAGTVVIALNLPSSGPYLVLTTSADGKGTAVEPPALVNGPKAAVEVPAGAETHGKFVLSVFQSAGQLATRRTVEFRSGAASITLKAADFDRIASLPVQVTSGGKAVSAALVELDGPDGAVVERITLLPGQAGIATFRDVPAGKDTIKVSYNDGQTATQQITVDTATPPERRKAEVTVAGATMTEPLKTSPSAAPAAAPARSGGAQAPAANDTSLFGFLVALAILCAIIYGAISYFRKRPEVLRGLAERLPLPDNEPEPLRPAPPPPVNVPPGTCPFCGAMKDPVTGSCACAVPVGASAGRSAGDSPGSGPRLIGLSGPLSGQAIPLGPSGITLGREATNDVALGNDSMASRRHARVQETGGAFAVHDEGSSNGTFVNGSRVTDAPLRPGDELTIGQSKFRFEE